MRYILGSSGNESLQQNLSPSEDCGLQEALKMRARAHQLDANAACQIDALEHEREFDMVLVLVGFGTQPRQAKSINIGRKRRLVAQSRDRLRIGHQRQMAPRTFPVVLLTKGDDHRAHIGARWSRDVQRGDVCDSQDLGHTRYGLPKPGIGERWVPDFKKGAVHDDSEAWRFLLRGVSKLE